MLAKPLLMRGPAAVLHGGGAMDGEQSIEFWSERRSSSSSCLRQVSPVEFLLRRVPARCSAWAVVCIVCFATFTSAVFASLATAQLSRTAQLSLRTASLNQSSAPGWLVERIFHEDGSVACPWTQAPAADADCLWRQARIEALRADIATCNEPLRLNEVVFAHRGAPLVAPEETEASWEIGVLSGAGLIECDAALTRDLHFICRHSTCDLAQTTDIVANHPEMLPRCSTPWHAATPAAGVVAHTDANVECCTYDFTLSELSDLCGIMDSLVNRSARQRSDYLIGPPGFRSPYLAQERCHSLVPLATYLRRARDWGVGVVPELKDRCACTHAPVHTRPCTCDRAHATVHMRICTRG